MKKYEKIENYILYLKKVYAVELSLKDFCGFVAKNPELDKVLRPYLAHTNPYCLFVKETESGYVKCLAQKRPMYEKCKEQKPFIGYCHAGVRELVVPIIRDGFAIGSINVGNFSDDEPRADRLICSSFRKENKARRERAKYEYERFFAPTSIEVSSILYSLELLAEYISEISLVSVNENTSFTYQKEKKGASKELSAAAKEYVLNHLADKFDLNELSTHLSVNKRALSNAILLSTGENYAAFVNSIKLEKAKELLVTTDLTVEQVAAAIGLETSYFNKLFANKLDISPSKYQTYYKNESLPLKEEKK